MASALMFRMSVTVLISAAVLCQADAQQTTTLTPPADAVQRAPARDYDLRHVALELKLGYETLSFQGVVTNTITPIKDGLTLITLQCGPNLTVESCQIDGKEASFTHSGDILRIAATQALDRDKAMQVLI